MPAAGENSPPFAKKAAVARGEGEGLHFKGGKPTQFEAFIAPAELCILRGDKHPTHIEMFVFGFIAPCGYRVDVQIEKTRGCEDQSLDSGFFPRFPTCNAKNIFVAIAVPSEGEPFVELSMVMKEGLPARGIHDQSTASKMCRETGAIEALHRGVEQSEHPAAEIDLFGACREVETCEGLIQIGTVHERCVPAREAESEPGKAPGSFGALPDTPRVRPWRAHAPNCRGGAT